MAKDHISKNELEPSAPAEAETTEADVASMNVDDMSVEQLKALLRERRPQSSEKEAQAARIARRVSALRMNAWAPPQPGEEDDYWTVIHSARGEGHLEYSPFLFGVDLEAIEPDIFFDDDQPPARSWISVNMRVGINWIPAKYFDGAGSFPSNARNVHSLVEAGILTCIPPGCEIPPGALGTSPEIIAAGDAAVTSSNDPRELRFTAQLMPAASEVRKRLLRKADAIEANKR